MFTPLVIGSSGFEANLVIATNTLNFNLKTAAIAAGWNQVTPLRAVVTVNAGVYVGSASTSSYSFTTDTGYPAGSLLGLINNGFILGKGGNGSSSVYTPNYFNGWYTPDSEAGGTAIQALHAITVINNGTIAGGGGGGGHGTSNRGYDNAMTLGGAGGGGAGYPGGSGGGPGMVLGSYVGLYAGDGTTTTGGARGGTDNVQVFATGGEGGGLAAAGVDGQGGASASSVFFNSGAGGAGGYCTSGNANITWSVTGTRYGTLG